MHSWLREKIRELIPSLFSFLLFDPHLPLHISLIAMFMTAPFPFLLLPLSSPSVWCGMSAVHLLLEVFSRMHAQMRT